MLKKLRLKNFKCFSDTNDIILKPLTFFVGPNSAGKSSIIQLLLMLKQTIISTDIHNPLIPNGTYVQLGGFPDFIYKHDGKKDLEIYLEFEKNIFRGFFKTPDPVRLSLNLSFYYNRKTAKIMLNKRETILGEKFGENIERNKFKRKYFGHIKINFKGKWNRYDYEKAEPIKFFSTKFSLGKKDFPLKESIYIFDGINTIKNYIETEFDKLYYLGPLREYPKRFYVSSGIYPKDAGIKGEQSADILWLAHRSKGTKIEKLIDEISEWFDKFNIAKNIKITPLGKKHYYYYFIEIIDPMTGIATNLADIGFGASQVLPIIIESFYAPPESIILIEQPEIHLHPKAQGIIGDLFIKATSNEENKIFIIETHSEHILARIRRRIAEGKIKHEKIAIYYFEPSVEGTKISEVKINEKGQYQNFPEGFFEEDIVEAFEHLKALQ